MTTRGRDEKRAPGASRKRRRRRRAVVVAVTAVAVVAVAAGVWLSGAGQTAHAYALAPESVLPPSVRQAPPKVREAYRFAVANHETLRWIPCFCGCGSEAHTSNADCYVKEVRADGSVVYDSMSLG